jgi:hypothetical protein
MQLDQASHNSLIRSGNEGIGTPASIPLWCSNCRGQALADDVTNTTFNVPRIPQRSLAYTPQKHATEKGSGKVRLAAALITVMRTTKNNTAIVTVLQDR